MYYAERGDGPPALALHAATAESSQMGWLVTALRAEGFNVITPDLRGHGQTPNPAGDLHLARLVDDLLEFVYLLGRGPVHGVGYSLGGGVLLYAAQRKPDLFRSLALLGTGYRAPDQGRLVQAIGPVQERSAAARAAFDPVTGVVVGWDAPLDSFRAILAPALIMCGDRDEFNDPEDSLALYRVLPTAELLVVPHTDHLGLVRHPMVHSAVREFYSHVPR
jgi:pimeloyl-ACP methyl ester carboxylesterase